MSLVRITSVKLDPLHNEEDRDYLQTVYSVNEGMNVFSPILYLLTPGCGNWLPIIDSNISTECEVSQRVFNIFRYPHSYS